VTGVQTCALPISPKPQNPIIESVMLKYKNCCHYQYCLD